MKKLFENVDGNRFKLISENITEDEPKSSLIRKGLKKVFSEGEKEYSYKKVEGVGLGYIRNVSEAKKCALKEAEELALEFGYRNDEGEQKFVKEDETDMSDPKEKREVEIGKGILQKIKLIEQSLPKQIHPNVTSELQDIGVYARELVEMHSPNGPVKMPGTGPKALYKRGSIY